MGGSEGIREWNDRRRSSEDIPDLCDVDLSADLRYADLRYADLGSADLRYADLSGAVLGLLPEEVTGAAEHDILLERRAPAFGWVAPDELA